MQHVWLIKMFFNETYNKVHIGKHLSDNFPIQNGLKQGDALSPLLFNYALEHAIRRVQENQVELKLNGTYQLLVYTDDVNLLGDDKYDNDNHKPIISLLKGKGLLPPVGLAQLDS
jgi:hypothetical protein